MVISQNETTDYSCFASQSLITLFAAIDPDWYDIIRAITSLVYSAYRKPYVYCCGSGVSWHPPPSRTYHLYEKNLDTRFVGDAADLA